MKVVPVKKLDFVVGREGVISGIKIFPQPITDVAGPQFIRYR
jgi:hypothetical protein